MTTTPDVQRMPTSAKCFRRRRRSLVVGLVGAVCFTALGVASTVVFAVDDSFPRPHLAALIVGAFWSAFTLLPLWLIAAYLRERLSLDNHTIVQHGVFGSKTLAVRDVVQVRWRNWPREGSLVVRTQTERVKIDLARFARSEREQVVRFFRETFAAGIQENWPLFEVRVCGISERDIPRSESPTRLPADTWECAGYLKEALTRNRRGTLHPSQRHLVCPPGTLFFGLACVVFAAWIAWLIRHAPPYAYFVLVPAFLLLFFVGVRMLWGYWRFWRGGWQKEPVHSVCGELTKREFPGGEGEDSWGFELGDGTKVILSELAYRVLPQGHYRIYHSSASVLYSEDAVVNVEEHEDGLCPVPAPPNAEASRAGA